MDLYELLEDFLEELRARRLQQSSIRSYELELRKLLKLLDEGATSLELQKYLSKRSAATHLRLFTIWQNFLRRTPLPARDLLKSVKVPKLRQRQPAFLTENESFLLEASCYRGQSLTRDRLFIALALQLGLRLNEILQLKFSDIEGDWIRIFRKGDKEQRLPLAPSLRSLLKFWKTETQSEPNDWLFPGRSGKPLGSRAAQMLMKKLVERSGLKGKRITPHSLRHTFATTLASRGASLIALKELLGHQRLSTTERYLHVTPTHLKDALQLLSQPQKPVPSETS